MKKTIFLILLLLSINVSADMTVEEQVQSMKEDLPFKIADKMTLTRIEYLNSSNVVVSYIVIDGEVKNKIKFVDVIGNMMIKRECTDPFKRILMHNNKLKYEYKYYDKYETFLGSNYIYEKKCVRSNYKWEEFYEHEVKKFKKEFNISEEFGIKSGRAFVCDLKGYQSEVVFKDNNLYLLTGEDYRKYIPTLNTSIYANENDKSYTARIDNNDIYLSNGIRESKITCVRK